MREEAIEGDGRGEGVRWKESEERIRKQKQKKRRRTKEKQAGTGGTAGVEKRQEIGQRGREWKTNDGAGYIHVKSTRAA